MGLPPTGWEAEPLDAEPTPLVSLRQMLSADLDQVSIRLMCTGIAAAIAETVEEFREVAPGCEVEVQENRTPPVRHRWCLCAGSSAPTSIR